jgi:hypothetical protein
LRFEIINASGGERVVVENAASKSLRACMPSDSIAIRRLRACASAAL